MMRKRDRLGRFIKGVKMSLEEIEKLRQRHKGKNNPNNGRRNTTKKCYVCDKILPLEKFIPRKNICRKCRNDYLRKIILNHWK